LASARVGTYLDDVLHLLFFGALEVLEVLQGIREVLSVAGRREFHKSASGTCYWAKIALETSNLALTSRSYSAELRRFQEVGEAVPVFLYTLLAVRDILVDFDHLCLKHYPVGLQPREHIDKVRLGLCGREAQTSHQIFLEPQKPILPARHAVPKSRKYNVLVSLVSLGFGRTVHSCCCKPLRPSLSPAATLSTPYLATAKTGCQQR
jgi:hypothetical protein